MQYCFMTSSCNSCIHADECEFYMSGEISGRVYHAPAIMKRVLCKSRHNYPVDEAIFPEIIGDPTNLDAMYEMADRKLRILEEGDTLFLYTSGLTPALLTVINWCHDHKITIEVIHYNKETGDYFLQEAR